LKKPFGILGALNCGDSGGGNLKVLSCAFRSGFLSKLKSSSKIRLLTDTPLVIVTCPAADPVPKFA